MTVFELTRRLVDIPSISNDEEQVGVFLLDHLSDIAKLHGGSVERMAVGSNRFNVFASWGKQPTVTFSTHMDTVPPFIPFSEDESWLYGRGSCDAKGILACMITAVSELLEEGVSDLGLLAVAGEERGSAGAYVAAENGRGSQYLINGEPTENKLVLGTKGALRLNLTAGGRMAHSAYPELGESAIDKLLTALERIRSLPLPVDPILGPSTLNIGTLQGGRAPNVIPDEAKAELLIRIIDDGNATVAAVRAICDGVVSVEEVLRIPAAHLGSLPGFETTSVAYTTDIPAFNGKWGVPFLLGPGTIHVAHTPDERVSKSEQLEAVALYKQLALKLLKGDG